MLKIDMMSNISDTRKRSLKIGIIKTQVQIRRKVLGQSVPITFTSNRKQRPITDIIQELHDVIAHSDLPAEFVSFLERPMTLIGKRIKQRFLLSSFSGLFSVLYLLPSDSIDFGDNLLTT